MLEDGNTGGIDLDVHGGHYVYKKNRSNFDVHH